MNGNHIAIEDVGLDVCCLEGSSETDGRGIVSLSIAAQLAQRGYEVDLFVKGPRRLHERWSRNVRLRNVGKGPFPTEAEDGTPYIVHIVNHWSVVDRLGETPVLYQAHEFERLRVERGCKVDPATLESQDATIRRSAAVMAPSQEVRQWVILHYGLERERVLLAPHGIDTNIFHPMDRRQARKKAGIPLEARTVLFVGRIEFRKGLDVLRDAFDRLDSDVALYIIGEAKGELDPNDLEVQRMLENWISSRDLHSRAHLLGALRWSELPAFYSAADVVALPSRVEPFGLPTIEALACGAPVVGSDLDGFREILRPAQDGLLVKAEDSQALANALSTVLSDPAWRTPRRIAERAARAEEFSWDRTARIVEEFLARLQTPAPAH